jgi:hypothetical protein
VLVAFVRSENIRGETTMAIEFNWKPTLIHMDRDHLAVLDKLAKQQGVPRAQLCREAVKEFIRRKQKAISRKAVAA